MRRSVGVLAAALIFSAQAAFAGNAIFASLPGAAEVGRGVLSYAFWDMYEARLYAPAGRFDPRKPVGLSIHYFHAISGADIADRSVQEIRGQGFGDEVKLAAWNAQLKSIFPDVRAGSVLSAVYVPGQKTTFYRGEDVIGTVKGDEFGRLFFGIWLSEKTSEPQLRRALLGLS